MKKILLNVDNLNHICSVPDIVEENLFDYIDDFYEYIEKFKLIKFDDQRYEFTDNEVDSFLHWLNRMFKEQSSVVEVIGEDKENKYKDLSSWNF